LSPAVAAGGARKRPPNAGGTGTLNQQADKPIINSEMIYDVYLQGDLIAETDSIDLVKIFIKENPGCSVKDAASGKEFVIKRSVDGPVSASIS
jgi:hypothetical protein